MNVNVLPLFSKPVLISETPFDMDESTYKFLEQMKPVQGKSNGSSTDRYILNLPELENLKNYIQSYIDYYWNNVIEAKDSNLYITQSWINSTTKNQYHHAHAHPNSLISGVLYLNADPKIDRIYFVKDSNPRVSLKTKNYNMFNSTSWFFSVKPGDLLIFPSSTNHYVAQKKENNKSKV